MGKVEFGVSLCEAASENDHHKIRQCLGDFGRALVFWLLQGLAERNRTEPMVELSLWGCHIVWTVMVFEGVLKPRMIEAGVRAGMADYDYRCLVESARTRFRGVSSVYMFLYVSACFYLDIPHHAWPEAPHCTSQPPMDIWRRAFFCCAKGRSEGMAHPAPARCT